MQLAAKLVDLLRGVDVLDRFRAQLVELGPEAGVLGLRVDQPGEPAVAVAEGRGDAVGADLEGPQHGRAGALDTMQAAARRLAEIDGDQDEREQHEHSRHDSPLEGGGTAGGKPGGPGARCGGPQDRNPCAAVPVLHENEPV
jgi:hypothetical protein